MKYRHHWIVLFAGKLFLAACYEVVCGALWNLAQMNWQPLLRLVALVKGFLLLSLIALGGLIAFTVGPASAVFMLPRTMVHLA